MTAIYPCPAFGLARLPHSTSCSKFIQCFAGTAVELDCGPGLAYKWEIEECVPKENSGCYRNHCPLYNDPGNLVFLPDYMDCDRYYLCHNNEPVSYRCAEGLHWDETNEFCATPADAECIDYEIECRPGVSHNVPNPRFCDRFYFCLNGESFPSNCPGDLVFDTVTLQCNYRDSNNTYPGCALV